MCQVLCWVLRGLGKIEISKSPQSPSKRGRHLDREARYWIPGALMEVPRWWSSGSKESMVTSPWGRWRGRCHEETLSVHNVASPV